jgi:hypothetical protein
MKKLKRCKHKWVAKMRYVGTMHRYCWVGRCTKCGKRKFFPRKHGRGEV